ncbi:PDC sensor domain-containing protein [Hydrogenobaculum acidophilum]
MDIGVDMFQGFLLSRPQCYKSIDLESISAIFKKLISKYETYRLTIIEKYIQQISTFKHIVENIAKSLTVENFKRYVDNYDFIRAIYLLDWDGNVVFDTILKRNHIKPLFKPAKKGDNLSFKEYFMHIRYYKKDLYISDPYISQADGKQCITVSCKVSGEKIFVLCVDFTL